MLNLTNPTGTKRTPKLWRDPYTWMVLATGDPVYGDKGKMAPALNSLIFPAAETPLGKVADALWQLKFGQGPKLVEGHHPTRSTHLGQRGPRAFCSGLEGNFPLHKRQTCCKIHSETGFNHEVQLLELKLLRIEPRCRREAKEPAKSSVKQKT